MQKALLFVFFILFLILSLFSVWTVGRLQIIDLLREARKQKVEPYAFSWKSGLSPLRIILVGIA
ncbi:hypothetical protein ACT4UT_30435, partial [Bacillus sp. B-TM1]